MLHTTTHSCTFLWDIVVTTFAVELQSITTELTPSRDQWAQKKCLTINALAPPAVFSFSFYSFSFLQPTVEWWDCFYSSRASNTGWFHLHILVFPFVYQFNSRIGVLVRSSFANFNNISASFQNLFIVVFTSKIMQPLHSSLLLYWNEMNVYYFNCHLSYWLRYRTRSELTSSKC